MRNDNMKKRFFGLHFDFHAGNDVEIGANTVPEDIERYINEAKPDFIQCDCKGHPGNCCYPTRVGKAADKLVKDNLRVWADTAKKHNLPLYVHYSGVYDAAYTKAHPEDATIDKDGNPTVKINLFGNYVRDLLIPQLKELITEYGIAGAWIDGEGWAVDRDYSEEAKKRMGENISEVEHNRIMREAFFDYVKCYVDEIHKFAPDFKITSNWLYSGNMPAKPEIGIDFISGDYEPNDSVHEVRHTGRCIAAQGMPWDLMAWAFERSYRVDKSACQLKQEAAAVLMLGGGFQMYIVQNRDGSARRVKSNRVAEVAEFVRKREMLFEKKNVAQVGIYHSAESYYQRNYILCAFGAADQLTGAVNAVLDAEYTAAVIHEHQTDSLDDYEIVIIPEWDYISPERKAAFMKYAENGGSLLVIGAECCRQIGTLCGKSFGETKEFTQAYILHEDGCFAGLADTEKKTKCRISDIKSGGDMIYEYNDLRYPMCPSYGIENYGKGKIAWIPFDFASTYCKARTYIYVDFIKKVLNGLKRPFIEINKNFVDMSLLKTENNGLLLNLLNMNQGRHSCDILTYNEIPEIRDIEIVVRKPYKNVSMPLGESFTFETDEETTTIRLDKLDIHSIIVLE